MHTQQKKRVSRRPYDYYILVTLKMSNSSSSSHTSWLISSYITRIFSHKANRSRNVYFLQIKRYTLCFLLFMFLNVSTTNIKSLFSKVNSCFFIFKPCILYDFVVESLGVIIM